MKLRAKMDAIAETAAYDQKAAEQSKANIFIATLVAGYIILFEDWGFGLLWFVVIPVLWLAASLLMALPFMVLKVMAVAALMDHPGWARRAAAAVDVLNYVVLIPTYLALYHTRAAFPG